MAIKLAAWNVQEGLAIPEKMPHVVEKLKWLNADVVVLSDAFSLDNDLHGASPETLLEAAQALRTEGYRSFVATYDDTEPWNHERKLVVGARNPVVYHNVVRLATRNAVELVVQDGASNLFHILGAHFDDRSELARMRQAKAAVRSFKDSHNRVLAGDLNTAHRRDAVPRVLGSRSARTATQIIPSRSRTGYNARRITEMCRGGALQVLEEAGFRDADCDRRPTFHARIPFLQLDHIMTHRDDAMATRGFELESEARASDHKAIAVTILT